MGYRAILTPKTGDAGKDIILKKDSLTMLIECKRYTSKKVTRPEIQKFHSHIMDMNATKGFYITTGEFTKHAADYAIIVTIKVTAHFDVPCFPCSYYLSFPLMSLGGFSKPVSFSVPLSTARIS